MPNTVSGPGPLNLITDIHGLTVGHAEDAEALTGTSVILCEKPATAAVIVAGGGPGTRETDLLAADTLVDQVDAIVLSGGSAYGLAAADGVAAELGAQGRGYGLSSQTGIPRTPIVPAAILYDLANGGNKSWGREPPYQALGRQALSQADKTFRLGPAGAGLGARAGQHRGGLGSASILTADGLRIGALAAVNSFGSVYMPGTDVFWAWPYERQSEFGGKRPEPSYHADADDWGAAKINPVIGQNTTLACLATNVSLTPAQARRVALMAQAGFARAIRPVFAPYDGDTLFVLSMGQQSLPEPQAVNLTRLGELGAAVLARAIARGVWQARKS